MRFIEDGPDIPIKLLDARDKGEVVFICGAGVSIPAGLPSFSSLTKQVLNDLGVSDTDYIQKLYDQAASAGPNDFPPPYDHIFSHLKREFGDTKVERSVFRRLRKPRAANVDYHRAILALSANVSGGPRVITTNFDLLFENAQSKLRTYVSPELPDFRAIDDFEGVVYLHGRLSGNRQATTIANPVILSSSDFGRAYLSQGWAARFVRELLQRYTVSVVKCNGSRHRLN